ncbi:GntR family transcriptional regulator [Microbacterium sp. RG1]|nr:GntR family transcriptional regulator [Microbacterium sp. RG1]
MEPDLPLSISRQQRPERESATKTEYQQQRADPGGDDGEELAKDLQVAAETVMRAYTELEADGLIETRAGSAARVRAGHRPPEGVRGAASALISAARQHDMTMSDTVQMVHPLWTTESETVPVHDDVIT